MRRRGSAQFAIENKLLLRESSEDLPHKHDVEVWSLSPSSFQFSESLGKMGALIPEFGRTKRRAIPTDTNDHSIVLWISIGPEKILLGGDLEEVSDPRAGWSAIVASVNRPQGRASIFKVPHHGSINGHHSEVWAKMLYSNPHAILTPWNRATRLPTSEDLARLSEFTSNVHLTAPPVNLSRVRHEHEVERLLRDFAVRTYRQPSEIGVVTARKTIGAPDWAISRSTLV
jgi:beta-lactamase superfamily II metal-dependent hydrolase